jgi:hypothetical protein
MRKVRARRCKHDSRSLAILVLAMLGVSAAVGGAIYNLDDAYLASKFNLVAYTPDRMLSGGEASMIVFAVDDSGDPVVDQPIQVIIEDADSSQTVWSGRTDGSGYAAPVFDLPSGNGKKVVVVKAGPEEIRTSTVFDDTIRLIITTDKPIYQPGQTLHMRILSFAGADPLPQESSVLLEVIDPNGDKVFKKELYPNEYGICSYDLALSDQLTQGTYTLSATSSDRSTTKAVVVKEYVLPMFRIDLLGLKDWYMVHENIIGVVSAEYFFGQMVEGTVAIDASVYVGVWSDLYETTGTLQYGEMDFAIPAVNYAIALAEGGNGYLRLNVTVTDTGGHEETRSEIIALAPDDLVVTVLDDSCVLGETSTFHVIVRTPDGRGVPNATVVTDLYDTLTSYHPDRILPGVKTDSRGIAEVSFVYEGEAFAEFEATLGYSQSSTGVALDDLEGLKVISDASSYDVGDIGTFDIVYSGESFTRTAYYDVVSRGFVVDRGFFELVDGRATIEVTMLPEMEPFAQMRVYKIEEDMGVARDAVTFSVGTSSLMDVDVSSSSGPYLPGDTVDVTISVENAGEPVLAALGIAAVDEAVFSVDSLFQGFEELVFGLDEEFIIPQYQILNYVFTGAGTLPTQSDAVVSELDEARVTSTWTDNMELAAAVKSDAIRGYWFGLYLCLGVAAIAIVGSRSRFGKKGAAVTLVVVLVTSAAGGTALYISTLGFGSSGSLPPRMIVPDKEVFFQETDAAMGLDFDQAYDDDSQSDSGASSADAPKVARQYFPETWYWNPFVLTDEQGIAELSLTAPDSITSWRVDVIASTIDGSVGTGTGSVTVFQEFFVDPDIPVSVVRGDEFPLRVMVYNYIDTVQEVNVTLVDDPWFTLMSPGTQTVTLGPDTVSSVTFTIVAEKVGWHTVTVNAGTADAADSVVKPLKVVPDGMSVETLYNGEIENGSATETLILDPTRIEDSENAWVKIQGGVEAVLLEGVDAFIQFVTGCGEQSLSMLSIDILAYDTVKKLGSAPEKLFKYESIVNQGIQHELTYLLEANNGQGRGIVWFPGDIDVHPWLTSWGLIAFQDAINAGFGLDDDIIADMQSWLMSIQEGDGSWQFPDWGIYEFNNPILKAKDVAATGYIARALVHSGVPGDDPHIQAAMGYVESNVDEVWDDSYSLSLSLLLLQAADGDQALRTEVADRLEELRQEEDGRYFWSSPTSLISDQSSYASWGSTRVIETTGYAAMALDGEAYRSDSVKGAVRYLLDNRESLGGWGSTQDTIVAFHALASVTSGISIKEVEVSVLVAGTEVFSVGIDDFNKDVTYLVDLRPHMTDTTSVTVGCTGEGTILYSIYLEQYVPWPDVPETSPFLTLEVTYDATHVAVDDAVTAHLYILYSGTAPVIKMLLVDLRAPMGLRFVLSEFESLDAAGTIASFDSNERQVLVYLTDVESGVPIEFDYSLVAEMPIKSTVQDICAWDMYDPEELRSEVLPETFEVVV